MDRFEVTEDLDRLNDIKDEMENLLREARKIVHKYPEHHRAEAYWIPHIKMALLKEHGYLGRSMCTMEDTINEMEESMKGENH